MTSKPPFSLVGIDHVVFLVDDMPKALKFYHEVLGCQPGYSYPKTRHGAGLVRQRADRRSGTPPIPAPHPPSRR